MTVGMQILFDEGGDAQIDDRFFNLAFISKHTVSCVSAVGGTTGPTGSLTVTGTMPMVAFAGGPAALHSITTVGSSFKFNFVTVSTITLTVYLFDVPKASGFFGLQIFNDAEQVTFDSSQKYMRIIYDREFSDFNKIAGVAINLPLGRTYAVLQGQFAGYKNCDDFIPGESGPIYSYTTIQWLLCELSGSAIYPDVYQVFGNQTSNVPAWVADVYSGRLQVLDVTGM